MKWVSAKFKDVFFIHGGNPSPKEGEFDEEGIPFVKMKDLGAYHHTTGLSETENKVSSKTIKSKRLKIIPKGSILIPRSGSVAQNHRAVLSQDSAIVSHICALEVKDKTRLFNLFAYYYLTTIDMVKITKKTTGLDAITFEDLAELEIPLPPLPVQKRIAEILDAADALRKKDQELLKKYDELAQAIFIAMFGDPVKNEKGWEKLDFGDVFDTRLGKMLDSKKQKGNAKYKYLGNSNVQWFRFNLDNLSEMEFDLRDQEIFSLIKGDILICEGGEVGRSAIWDRSEKIYFQKALHRARPKENNITPEYTVMLFWFLSKNNGFKDYVSTSTISHLTGEKLKTIQIPVPDYKLQVSYSNIISAINKLSSENKNGIDFGNHLFITLIQKAFSGELVS